jgi:FkbM family methyltransferase
MTPEQVANKVRVWQRMAEEHPEFTRDCDPTDNFHTVEEIILGGSLTWKRANELFQPFRGARVMDLGANVGIYTAYCAANEASVTAYEPYRPAWEILCTMLRDTELRNRVAAYQIAIWTHAGNCAHSGNTVPRETCTWYNGAVPQQGLNPTEFADKGHVNCISLATAIGEKDWDCVKMDIEGAEFEVLLSTAEETLRRIKFMYVEFHPWAPQKLYEDTIKYLESVFNFEGYWSNALDRWEVGYCLKKGD